MLDTLRFECWNGRACWWNHLELIDYLYSLPHIERKWSERRLYVYLTLLSNLVLRDDIEISERFVHERSHISRFLQDLGIVVVVNKREKLVENALDVCNLFKV